MESFYRYMRKKHYVLMSEDGKPVGSKWNFDHENRKAWKGDPKSLKIIGRFMIIVNYGMKLQKLK